VRRWMVEEGEEAGGDREKKKRTKGRGGQDFVVKSRLISFHGYNLFFLFRGGEERIRDVLLGRGKKTRLGRVPKGEKKQFEWHQRLCWLSL